MKRLWISLTVLFVTTRAFGFDTGVHTDVTSAAMIDFGFSSDAVKIGRLENWLVDYYSNTGDYEPELALLHFDNLPTTHKVLVYWGHLTNNMRYAVQKAAQENNPFKALCLVGMSLHALQDFYTHSTWVENHPAPAGQFRADTFFTDIPFDNSTPQSGIYTGLYPGGSGSNAGDSLIYHGDNFFGVNHDNYNRPLYDYCNVFAYSATVQWLRAVYRWTETIRPGFFKRMTDYTVPSQAVRDALNLDIEYSYYISEWTFDPRQFGGSNGKWKAWGSGSFPDFVAATANFKAEPDDMFTLQFKPPSLLFRQLTPNLDNLNGLIPLFEPLPKPNIKRRAVYLYTSTARDDTALGLDFGAVFPYSYPDFFAAVAIGNQSHFEPTWRDLAVGTLGWRTIKLVPQDLDKVKVTYQLFDEDKTGVDIHAVNNDFCDINPALNRKDLRFNYQLRTHRCTGNVNGTFDNVASLWTSSGTESNKCTIWFYVTDYPVIDP